MKSYTHLTIYPNKVLTSSVDPYLLCMLNRFHHTSRPRSWTHSISSRSHLG